MAAKRENNYRTYVIPENFIDSGRCLHGMFKTRGLVEGLILGGVAGFIAFLFPIKEIETRIPVILCTAAPFFGLGVVGINGDPLSVFLKYAYTWVKSKGVILYNGNTRFLDESPLDKMMEQTDVRDKIFEIMDKRKKAKEEENAKKEFVEGVDFQFGNDEDNMAVVVAPEFFENEEVEVVAEDDAAVPEDYHVYGDTKSAPVVSIGTNDASKINAMDDALGLTGHKKQEPKPVVKTEEKKDEVVQMKLRIDLKKMDEEELF